MAKLGKHFSLYLEIPDVLLGRNWLLSPAFIYAQIHTCHLTDFLPRKMSVSVYITETFTCLYDFISYCTSKRIFVNLTLMQTNCLSKDKFLGPDDERTSMIKACIFPKSLKRQSQTLKRMNCAKFVCVWSNIYVNHMKTNFWWFKIVERGR